MYSLEVDKRKGFSPTVEEFEYVIPSGKSVAVEIFQGGHEYSSQEVRIELLERTAEEDVLINCGYGQNFTKKVGSDFVGDGDRKIVVRMTNGDTGDLHMTASWHGRIYDNG